MKIPPNDAELGVTGNMNTQPKGIEIGVRIEVIQPRVGFS